MIVNMVLAVAPVPAALGAVAKLQAGVGQLRAAADGAAEPGLALLVGDLVDPALLDGPLPALVLGMVADEVRQDVGRLLSEEEETLNIIMVDDEGIILSGGLPVLEEVFPNANISGFTRPSEAIAYAQNNRVALAFLDIEMGKLNGMELCRELQRINPQTNVIFLTAYLDYSLDAWKTGASGFIIKKMLY